MWLQVLAIAATCACPLYAEKKTGNASFSLGGSVSGSVDCEAETPMFSMKVDSEEALFVIQFEIMPYNGTLYLSLNDTPTTTSYDLTTNHTMFVEVRSLLLEKQ